MVNGLSHLDDVGCYPKSPGWHNKIWTLNHTDDLANCSISSGLLMYSAGCHPDDLQYYPISSEGQNVIWTLSHPDELQPDCISSGWLMAGALCHRDDLAGVGISSGWVTENSLCHPQISIFHNTRWPFSASERSNYAWDHGVDCKGEKPVISRHSNPKSCIDGNYIHHQWRD